LYDPATPSINLGESTMSDAAAYGIALNSISGALTTFSKSDIGDTESSLQSLLSSSKFSTFASSLGLLGAGLGILNAAGVFGKSDTAQILDAIGGLSSKIDDLKSTMLAKFDHVEAVVDFTSAKSDIAPYIATLDTLKSLVNNYRVASSDADREEWAGRILEFKSSEVAVAVQGIANASEGEPTANSLFASLLAESYGDMELVMYFGNTLMGYCAFAVIVDAMIDYLTAAQDFTAATSDEDKLEAGEAAGKYAAELYTDNMTIVHDAWYGAYQDCMQNVDTYIGQKMTGSILSTLSASDHTAASEALFDALKEQWFWYDWFVVLYDDVSGYNNHAWWGWNQLSWKRQQVDGGKVNIVVKYTDKDVTATGSTLTTKMNYTVPFTGSLVGVVAGGKLYSTGSTYTGNAEDYPWTDLREMINNLAEPYSSPGLVWACARHKGVHAWWSRSSRVLWENGKYFTVARFH
jgi:hypothetical protein